MIHIKKKNFLFISSNILFFLTILLTYFDLNKFSISDEVYLYEFSFLTYGTIVLFLINLIFLYIFEINDKNVILNFYFYYLLLSSGFYIINFPIMDELILITTAFTFLIFLTKEKTFKLDKKTYLILLIFVYIFFQSVIGIFHDLRSLRYVFISSSIIVTLVYFSNNGYESITENKNLINYMFLAIFFSIIYQIFFWILKFYVFEMKFADQTFIGHLQPSYSKSASGHVDAINIVSVFLFLYFSVKKIFLWKRFFLFFSVLSFWILSDARSSFFLFTTMLLFYFVLSRSHKKILLLLLIPVLFFFINIFDFSYIKKMNNRAINIFSDFFDVESGMTEAPAFFYDKEKKTYYYQSRDKPKYGDLGRLAYVSSAISATEKNFIGILFGCGFYGYYKCAQDSLDDFYKDKNVTMTDSNRGFMGSKIRPPAAGTIIVENGLIIILILMWLFISFVRSNINRNLNKTLLSFYIFSTLMVWAYFSNLLDIIFIYYFMMPFLYKSFFYKI